MTAKKSTPVKTIALNVVVITHAIVDVLKTFAYISFFMSGLMVMYANAKDKEWLSEAVDSMTSTVVSLLCLIIAAAVLRFFLPGKKSSKGKNALAKESSS
jgi:hypothetical protein